jgi:predicted transcriptional regulator
MKRTTVKLPDELDYQLRYKAARRQMTVSELTREAIETYLGVGQRRKLLSVGAGNSGQSDISERMEELLREEWQP